MSIEDLVALKCEQSKLKSSLKLISRDAFMTVTEENYKTKTGSEQSLIRIDQLSHELLTEDDQQSVSQASSVGDLVRPDAKLKLDIE